jgi:predicted metal-dependent hydrolase
LKVLRDVREPLTFDGKNFILHPTALAKATEHFRRWYIRNGTAWLHGRANLLSRRIGVTATRVVVRELGYRWGSCGRHGVLYFNWRLLQLPVRVIDYVIAHELAHLIEPHHGRELWRLLDRSLPDWRIRSEELKVSATHVYWCHDRMR